MMQGTPGSMCSILSEKYVSRHAFTLETAIITSQLVLMRELQGCHSLSCTTGVAISRAAPIATWLNLDVALQPRILLVESVHDGFVGNVSMALVRQNDELARHPLPLESSIETFTLRHRALATGEPSSVSNRISAGRGCPIRQSIHP